LTKYNEPVGLLTVTGPKTLVLPADAAGPITSTTAENVTLTKHECVATPNIPAVKNLVLGALNSTLNFDVYTQLVTADISGKAQSTWAATLAIATDRLVGNPALTTIKIGGNIQLAEINLCPKLTSLTTTGSVNSLFVGNNDILETMSLGHTAYMGTNGANGGPGSELRIVQNPKLKSLKSSTDYPAVINIGGNPLLATLDLSSYKTPLLAVPGALTSIYIHTNMLSGDYINAVGITPTTPYRETVIKQAGLATLKTLIAKYPDAPNPPALDMQISADLLTLNGSGVEAPLNTRIWGDTFHTIANGASFDFAWPAVGLVTKQEFALVQ
ncbi:MAG: hypothetical protein LWW85_14845, partial [Marinilabiliales bacterium]|nr:hypothetical protein [Marinilabiliales bacterium]